MPIAALDVVGMLITQLEVRSIGSAAEAAQLLGSADLRASDLTPWQEFDHPVQNSYGRKLLYQGSAFELMVMSWLPGDFSEIHDHGQAQWGAVQIFGPAQHLTFEFKDSVLCQTSSERVVPGAILEVSHELLHQMGNPSEESFLSLHLYGAMEPREMITAEARIFDASEGCIKRTNGGVFFDLPESEILSREPGLKSDFQVQEWHREKLRDRILKVRQSETNRL